MVRKGTLKTLNKKEINGKTCSPPQTEAWVRAPCDHSPFPEPASVSRRDLLTS